MKSCTFDPRVLGYESLSLQPRTSDLQTGFVESSNSRDLIFGLSFHLERKIFGLLTLCYDSLSSFASVVLPILDELLAPVTLDFIF